MMLTAAYFDESTDDSEMGHCYTVAGYLGNLCDAATLDMRWKDLLDKYQMAYFKASEVEYCAGELRKYREASGTEKLTQKDKDFKNKVKTEFVDLICDMPDLTGISATILLQDWNRFKVDEPELFAKLPSLYNLSYKLMLMEAGLLIGEHNANPLVPKEQHALIRPVIDSHEEYEPAFMSSYPVWCKKNPNSARFMLPPFFESDQTYRCLQAADCLAYEARRLVAGHKYAGEGYQIRAIITLTRPRLGVSNEPHRRVVVYCACGGADHETSKHVCPI